MKRSTIEAVKTEAARLLERIAEMERSAGWKRYEQGEDKATIKPHPNDNFNPGQFTAAVKRANMDLSRALVEIRK